MRTVFCKKLSQNAAGLEAPPFSGPLGEEIFHHISKSAWEDWRDNMMIKVINEYRLNLAEPEQYNTLLQQMRAYLNLDAGVQSLEVENVERGRGEHS